MSIRSNLYCDDDHIELYTNYHIYTNLLEKYGSFFELTFLLMDKEEIVNLLEFYTFNGLHDRAIKLMDIVYAKSELKNSLLLEFAQYYYMIDEDEMALKLIEEAELLFPNNQEIVYWHALILCRFEHYNEAISLFEKCIKLQMSDSELQDVYLEYAECYIKLNHINKGINIFKKGIRSCSQNDIICNEFVNLLSEIGELKLGIDFFNKQLQNNPFSFTEWFYLGNLYDWDGNLHKAKNAYENAALFSAEKGEIYHYLAEIYERLGDYERAIKNYKQELNEDDDYNTNTSIARCYLKLNEIDLAQVYLNLSKDTNEEFEYYFWQGCLYLQINKPDKAIPYFLKYLSYKEFDLETHKMLLACYVGTNKVTETKELFNIIRETFNEKYQNDWKEIASILYNGGQDELFAEVLIDIQNIKYNSSKISTLYSILKYNNYPTQKNKEAIISLLLTEYDDTLESVKLFAPELYEEDEEFKLNLQAYKDNNTNE